MATLKWKPGLSASRFRLRPSRLADKRLTYTTPWDITRGLAVLLESRSLIGCHGKGLLLHSL